MAQPSVLERRESILDVLHRKGRVMVRELSELTGVSEATVRRDLRVLGRANELDLVHGGAVMRKPSEQSLASRASRNRESKAVIGQLAGALVADGDLLFLDPGTTCWEMVPTLRTRKTLSVIVNSTRLAMELGENSDFNVVLIGGHYRPELMDCFGPLAANAIDEVRGYRAFVGADGLSPEFGVSANDIQTAYLFQHVLRNARETILLADHSKFAAPSLFKICDLDAISVVVTDRDPGLEWREQFLKRDIRLIFPEVPHA
jgi:DeoR family transcriptional regulator of aga operon